MSVRDVGHLKTINNYFGRAPLWSSGQHIGQRHGKSAIQILAKANNFATIS